MTILTIGAAVYDGGPSSPVELSLAVPSPAVRILLAVAVGTEASQPILQWNYMMIDHHRDQHQHLHKYCSAEQLQGPVARPQGSPESSSHQTKAAILTNYYCIDFGINNSVVTSTWSQTPLVSLVMLCLLYTTANLVTSPPLNSYNLLPPPSTRPPQAVEYFRNHHIIRNANG